MTINAYPLSWPTGWPRVAAHLRKGARFTKGERQHRRNSDGSSSSRMLHKSLSVIDGIGRVLQELERMGIERQDVVISTNLRTRLDGLPRSGESRPDDPGVAVYWQDALGSRRVMAIDIYTEVADNLAAVAASLDAMRAIERHGGAQILERAFTGFTALPEPGKSQQHWRDVLGLRPATPQTTDSINAAYRRLAADAHPDRGGSHERMAEINRARDEALRECAP